MSNSFSGKREESKDFSKQTDEHSQANQELSAVSGEKEPKMGRTRPPNLSISNILTLQRSIGNQAVLKLLGKQKKPLSLVQRTLTVNGVTGSPFSALDSVTIKHLVTTFNLKKAEAVQLRAWAASSTPDDPQAFANWKEAIDQARLITLKAQAQNRLANHIKVRDMNKNNEIAGCHDETAFRQVVVNIGATINSETPLSPGITDIEYTMPAGAKSLVKTVHDSTVWDDTTLVNGVAAIVKSAFDGRTEEDHWVANLNGKPIMIYLNTFEEISNFHFVQLKNTPGEIPIQDKLSQLLTALGQPNIVTELNKRNITKTQTELQNLVTALSTNPNLQNFNDWVAQTWPVKHSPEQLVEHINELREADKRLQLMPTPTVDVSESKVKDEEGFPVTSQTADLEYGNTQVEIKTVAEPIKSGNEINAQLSAALAKFKDAPTSLTQSYQAVIYASYDPVLLAGKQIKDTPNYKEKHTLQVDGKLDVEKTIGTKAPSTTPKEFFESTVTSLNTDSKILGRDKVNLVTLRMENGNTIELDKLGNGGTWRVKR